MAKRIKIEESNGETQLLREIIHHIQSFLNGKEAARTTILSKSWYGAWLTRPNLDFSEADIPTTSFLDFGKKTIQRYEKSNLKIQSFKLLIDGKSSKDYLSDRISVAEDWTRKAIKLGATDIDVKISYKNQNGELIFVLPQEVFESKTLVKLSLVGSCKIDLKGKKVNCTGLKSLHLGRLGVEADNNIWDIISIMCPLIEKLVLSKCSYRNSGSYEKLVLKSGLGFRKLKVLLFKDVEFGEGFFDDFSSKFPCLKDLSLHYCKGCDEKQICSDSIERINFVVGKINVLNFDFPRIKRFELFSSSIPSLSFKTTSTKWESRISICCSPEEISRFTELRKFLQELSPSKIDLNWFINLKWNEYDYAGNFKRLPKPPTVENLTISISCPSSIRSVVFEDFFWICRPKFLVLKFWPLSMSEPLYKNSSDLMKLICNIKIEKGNENPSMTDLKEVKFEFFGQGSGGKWLPLSCKTLIEASAYGSVIIVKLQLKWVESI